MSLKLTKVLIHAFAALILVAVTGVVSADETTEQNYQLGQGDKIAIKVFDEPDLSIDSSIGATGIINYSYLGDLQVTGKTAEELEKKITALLKDGYLVNPSVNVTVVQYRPFFINGEVRAPGSYPYQPGLTLDKAIALAGGLTDRASTRKMYLLPASTGNSNTKAGKVKMSAKVNPGDIITIKEGFF